MLFDGLADQELSVSTRDMVLAGDHLEKASLISRAEHNRKFKGSHVFWNGGLLLKLWGTEFNRSLKCFNFRK